MLAAQLMVQWFALLPSPSVSFMVTKNSPVQATRERVQCCRPVEFCTTRDSHERMSAWPDNQRSESLGGAAAQGL